VSDNSRIEDLRRRVQKDPASIAFAQLAEEHRRAGQYEEAVEVATAGLAHHPAYLSARVTLGRALLELGRLDEAAAEFEFVVRTAPDNLTAVRQLADIHQRRRQSTHESRSRQPEVTVPPVRVVEAASLAPEAIAPPAPPPEPVPVLTRAEPPPSASIPSETAARSPEELVIAELEEWLAVIETRTEHAHTR
jgi:tetratricopeptide (TPR) repeat protein